MKGNLLDLSLSNVSLFLPLPPVGSHLQQLPNNTLLIQNVKREDAGTYICRAKIKGRPASNELRVSVVVNGQVLFQYQLDKMPKSDNIL